MVLECVYTHHPLFVSVDSHKFFLMVYICHGSNHRRLVLDCSRFYSKEELFRISRETQKGKQTFLEYGPNLYQPIVCDTELKLACSMVEGHITSHQSDEDLIEHRRCQMDALHTTQFEAKMKRKARTNFDEQKKKASSVIESVSTEEIQETPSCFNATLPDI